MFMLKRIFTRVLILFIVALPFGVFAQGPNLNRADLLEKTWYFVAMKCPDNLNNGTDGQFVHFYSSLKLTATNGSNINYGTYERYYNDLRDNPRELGAYSLTTDEVGNLLLTLKKAKSNVSVQYIVPFVETNHLTLIRNDEIEKCKVVYAISL
jgi:hypothetical protein